MWVDDTACEGAFYAFQIGLGHLGSGYADRWVHIVSNKRLCDPRWAHDVDPNTRTLEF
jgi:hypothetical protein